MCAGRVRFTSRGKRRKEERRKEEILRLEEVLGGGGREGRMVGLGEEGRDRRGHQGSPSILQFPLTTRYP